MEFKATEKLNRVESVADEIIKVDSVAEPSKTVKKAKYIIKTCKILYWNKNNKNLAFEFDDKIIQITLKEPLKECGSAVKIKYKDGKYELVER